MPDDTIHPPMRIAGPAPTKGPLIEQSVGRTALGLGFAVARPSPVRGPLIEGRPGDALPKGGGSAPEPSPEGDEDDEDEDDNGVPAEPAEGDEQPTPTPEPEPEPAPSAPRNAATLIAAAQGATTGAELDAIEAQAQGRSSVLNAVRERRSQI